MSRKPQKKAGGSGSAPQPAMPAERDPRALGSLDMVAAVLVGLAILLAPLLAGGFANPPIQQITTDGGTHVYGFPVLLGLVGAGLAALLYREWRRPVAIGPAPAVTAAFGLVCLWALLTVARSQELFLSINALAALVAAVVLGGMAARLARDRAALYALMLVVVFSGCLVAALGVREYAEYYQAKAVLHRIFATFDDPNFLAGYLALTLPLTMALFASVRSRTFAMLLGLGVALQTAAAFLSGSRAGVAMVAFGVLAWIGMAALARAARGNWPRVAGAVALAGVGAVLGSAPLFSRVAPPAAAPAAAPAATAPAAAQDHSAAFRLSTWIGALHMAKANPLLGTGVGTFEVAYPRYAETGYTAHAHDSYLQWSAETGLPGLLLLLGGLAAATAFSTHVLLLRRGARSEPEPGPASQPVPPAFPDVVSGAPRLVLAALLAGALASMLHNLIDSDWYVVGVLVTLSVVVALAIALARDIAPLTTQTPRPFAGWMLGIGALVAALLLWRAGALGLERTWLAQGGARSQQARAREAAVGRSAAESEYTAAWNGFQSAAGAEPLDPEPHMLLAEVSGSREEARRELTAAARLAHIGKTYYRLGQFYASTGRPKDAIDNLNQAREWEPRNLQSLDALGRSYLADNQVDQAARTFRTVTDLEQTSYGRVRAVPELVETEFAVAHAALGDIATSAGHWQEAATEYEQAARVLREYWSGRNFSGNLSFRTDQKRTDIAQLYDTVLSRWEDALARLGRHADADRVDAERQAVLKDREADRAAAEKAAQSGAPAP